MGGGARVIGAKITAGDCFVAAGAQGPGGSSQWPRTEDRLPPGWTLQGFGTLGGWVAV